MINQILVLSLNIALASLLTFVVGLTLVRCCKTLPLQNGILMTILVVSLTAPIAIFVGSYGGFGCLPNVFTATTQTKIARASEGSRGKLGFATSKSSANSALELEPTSNTMLDSRSESRHGFGESKLGESKFAESKPEQTKFEYSMLGAGKSKESTAIDSGQSHLATLETSSSRKSRLKNSVLSWQQSIGVGFVFVWFVGILISGIGLIQDWVSTKRLLAQCRSMDEPCLKKLVLECSSNLGLKRTPLLLESNVVPFPAVTGFRKPKLILPANFLRLSSETGIRMMLSHELAHLRRQDHRSMWVPLIASVFYWWNPLVHLTAAKVSSVREMICDDIAINGTGAWNEYARSIISIAEKIADPNTARCALGMSTGDLNARVKRLVDSQGRSTATQIGNCWLMSLVVAGTLGVCSLVVAQVPTQSEVPQVKQPNQRKLKQIPVATENSVQAEDPMDSELPNQRKSTDISANSTDESADTFENKLTQNELIQEQDDPVVIGKSQTPLSKIHGVVYGVDGQPEPNALIEVVDNRVVGSVNTDANGQFEFLFNSRAMGWSGLIAKSADGQQQAIAPGWTLFRKKPSEATFLELRLEQLASYSIKVQDEDGKAMQGIYAFGLIRNHSPFRFGGKTDERGMVTIQLPVAEPITRIIAFHPTKGLDYKTFGVPNEQINKFEEPRAFKNGTVETLTLNGTAPFSATVVDQLDKPLSGADMHPWILSKPGYEQLNLSDIFDLTKKKTDASGKVTFPWFPKWQKYRVTLWTSKTGYNRTRGAYLPGSNNGWTKVKLESLTEVSGKVVDQQGNPVAGILVKADGKKCHEQHVETLTDGKGNYRFYVRPDQNIIVLANEGSADERRRVSNFARVAVPRTGARIENVNLKLVQPVKVNGRIVNRTTDKLVSGFRMGMSRYAIDPDEYETRIMDFPTWNAESIESISNSPLLGIPAHWDGGVDTETGEFEMLLAPGVYTLRANDNDKSKLFVIKPVNEMDIELKTIAGAKEQISGRLTVEGRPMADAAVVAVNKRFRGDRWEATTNEKGEYKVNIREEPGLVVAFSSDKSFAAIKKFDVVKPVTDLELLPVAKISGRLFEANGTPLVGTHLYFGTEAINPRYGGFVVTDKEGCFEIQNVCPKVGLVLSVDNQKLLRRETLLTLPPLSPGQSVKIAELKLSEGSGLLGRSWPQ